MSTATHFQTVAAAEEQYLASMSTTTTSSSTSTSTKTAKVKTTKKLSKKTSASSIEVIETKNTSNNSIANGIKDQQHVEHSTEESHMSQETTSTMIVSSDNVLQQKSKSVKKKLKSATSVSKELEEEQQLAVTTIAEDTQQLQSATTKATNGKKKVKKSKKSDAEKENISVKSSFSKFDALQKKNLIHVRSSDAGKAQEKFSEPQTEKDRNCRLCTKPVYKMEEIKAEKSIYHKNCFRCQECDKQLKVDNYQSHEGVLYCMVHFKLLFAPKFVEDSAPEKPRKHELIIRENQPEELPPDVVRASDKPDLGLQELQQLNVRSKFQVFENGSLQTEQTNIERSPSNVGVKRSSSILSKMAKLQARGFNTGLSVEQTADEDDDADSCASSASGSDQESSGTDDGDRDLVRSKKRTQRERPVGIGNAMNDIKTKFEKGHIMSKEERREERKQEIQNIRSRLFMGKQARIKEMYQQAVADSEQAITSVGKKSEIDIGDKARSLKARFENGEMFKDRSFDNENEGDGSRSAGMQVDDADVFESAITKKSRSIFMELDANTAAGKNQTMGAKQHYPGIQRNPSSGSNRFSESEQENSSTFQQQQQETIKHDEKAEDIKIATSEISSKFKFFETYRPTECQKKEFRITPPREGVVKLPTTEELEANITKTVDADAEIIGKTHTASTMLNKFREMEQRKHNADSGPRPLKCFTPPPDGGRRLYQEQESDAGSEEYEEEEDEEEDDEECEEEDEQKYRRSHVHLEDVALQEAQAEARAKQLRAKFEKWEANEIQREMNEGRVNIYSDHVSDDTTIESTKSIRDRFENMKNLEKKSPAAPRYQVNRFV